MIPLRRSARGVRRVDSVLSIEPYNDAARGHRPVTRLHTSPAHNGGPSWGSWGEPARDPTAHPPSKSLPTVGGRSSVPPGGGPSWGSWGEPGRDATAHPPSKALPAVRGRSSVPAGRRPSWGSWGEPARDPTANPPRKALPAVRAKTSPAPDGDPSWGSCGEPPRDATAHPPTKALPALRGRSSVPPGGMYAPTRLEYNSRTPVWTAVMPILFYNPESPYAGFSNTSNVPVMYRFKQYPTAEHLYQSFKFQHRPEIAELIRTCSINPNDACAQVRRYRNHVRSDWEEVKMQHMETTLFHKFNQHEDLMSALFHTERAELIYNSRTDGFWGFGSDGKGSNELGKALMRLRESLYDDRRRQQNESFELRQAARR